MTFNQKLEAFERTQENERSQREEWLERQMEEDLKVAKAYGKTMDFILDRIFGENLKGETNGTRS